jgi:hypothetical protein
MSVIVSPLGLAKICGSSPELNYIPPLSIDQQERLETGF